VCVCVEGLGGGGSMPIPETLHINYHAAFGAFAQDGGEKMNEKIPVIPFVPLKRRGRHRKG
jgi:hypothetical protein